MSTDPQAPDGGYALTPENTPDATDTSATNTASTAHHEELLRTEALAARRGNRAIARFAVAGLVAALAVGVVTWRNSVGSDTAAQASDVLDASAGSAMESTPPPAPQTTRATSRPESTVPAPVDVGGVAQLSEDPYLPPNAWNGGDSLAPWTPEHTAPTTAGTESTPPETTEDRPTLPSLPGLPTIPGWPTGPNDGSSTPGETSENPSNGISPTEEPGETDPGAANSTEPGESAHPSQAGGPAEPTEPTELEGRSVLRSPSSTVATATVTDATNAAGRSSADRD